jgi:hypothetical protein
MYIKRNAVICTSKTNCGCHIYSVEAESKEKHGVWDPKVPMLELTLSYNLTLCTPTHCHEQPNARVDLNPMPESTLSPPVRDFGFGL